MSVTIAAICDGIAETLSEATGINSAKSYDEILEGIPAPLCPLLQVYPDEVIANPNQGTERTAFSAGIQQLRLRVFVDHFARKRSHLDRDMRDMVVGLDALIDVLQDQEDPPFFGVSGIKSFDWSWRRAVLRYGDSLYTGGRFTLTLTIF